MWRFVFSVLSFLVCVPAFGQDADQPIPLADGGMTIHNKAGTAPAPTPTAQQRAKSLYESGRKNFESKRYDVALKFFDQAHMLDPSNILVYNIARCNEELGRPASAIHYFGIYLARTPDAEDANAVREKMAILQAQLVPNPDRLLASNGDGLPVDAPPVDTRKMRHARDQGILYFKRNKYQAAYDQFEEAHKLPGGEQDGELQLYRAKVARQLGEIERAFAILDLALEASMGNDRLTKQVVTFADQLNAMFVMVSFQPLLEGLVKAKLVADTGIINPDKRKQVDKVQERLERGVTGKVTMALPPGDYKVNGHEFTLIAGKPASVEIRETTLVAKTPLPAAEPPISLIAATPPPEQGIGLPPWESWVLFGTAAVAAGNALYFGLDAQSMSQKAEGGALIGERYTAAKSIFEERQLAANISLGVAGAAALAGGILWWLDDTSTTPSISETPRVSPTPGGAVLEVTW